MKYEPTTFRCIKEGSIIYKASPISDRHYKIKKKTVYTVNKIPTEYVQRNVIFFGICDYFYASPNNKLEYTYSRVRYCPNLKNLINHLTSINCTYEF